jgi:hypothetical protein
MLYRQKFDTCIRHAGTVHCRLCQRAGGVAIRLGQF